MKVVDEAGSFASYDPIISSLLRSPGCRPGFGPCYVAAPRRRAGRHFARFSGSVRRRCPVSTPVRPNSRSSRASSVTSSANGHASPAAAARFRLSWTVDRATLWRRPISRALTPPWRSRSRCRSCHMLSSRFAGIPISSSTIDGRECASVADLRGADAERLTGWWPASFRNGGRLQIGTVASIKSKSVAGLRRNSQDAGFTSSPDCSCGSHGVPLGGGQSDDAQPRP